MSEYLWPVLWGATFLALLITNRADAARHAQHTEWLQDRARDLQNDLEGWANLAVRQAEDRVRDFKEREQKDKP